MSPFEKAVKHALKRAHVHAQAKLTRKALNQPNDASWDACTPSQCIKRVAICGKCIVTHADNSKDAPYQPCDEQSYAFQHNHTARHTHRHSKLNTDLARCVA